MSKSQLIKALFLGLILVLVSTSYTWARAGGGESFGDGGFDTGGSIDFGGDSSFGSTDGFSSYTGGSGGGTGVSFWVCIIFLIIIVVFAYIGRSRAPSGGGVKNTQIPVSNRSQEEDEIKAKLGEIKKTDPKFDTQKFKSHTKKVFMTVQEGWTVRDQEVCRPFMAEEVYQSHQMQIDSMKRNKTINVLENIVVGSTEIVRIDLDSEYHKITVKVRASMKDYKVKEENPDKIIEGSRQQTPPFTEYWVFIRKSDLKTKVKDGIFDRKCPNCGAPIKVDVAGVCKYCEANVVNGDYDWVLSEIIQRSEWSD